MEEYKTHWYQIPEAEYKELYGLNMKVVCASSSPPVFMTTWGYGTELECLRVVHDTEGCGTECYKNLYYYNKGDIQRADSLFFQGNYSSMGRSSAYIDAYDELREKGYPPSLVQAILDCSLFNLKSS